MTADDTAREQLPDTREKEIRDHLAAIPAPPWHWIGSTRTGPILATKHSGWRYVMGFRRLGMQGAQPDFPVPVEPHGHTILTAAVDQVIPRADYDPTTIRGIANPVAEWLEHSPQYVAELLDEIDRLRALVGRDNGDDRD